MRSLYISICKFFFSASLIFVSLTASAQVVDTPTYQLYITHDTLLHGDTLQFDVYLLRTGSTPFYLSGLDMGIGFDTTIVNAGTLSAAYVSGFSDLVDGEASANSQVSVGPTAFSVIINATTYKYRYFNVASQNIPSDGVGTLISNVNSSCTSPTRVGRFQLIDSKPFTSGSTPHFAFSTSPGSGKKNTNVSAFWGECTPCNTDTSIVITVAASNLNFSNNPCDPGLILNGSGCTPPPTPVVSVVNNCGNSVLSTTAAGALLWSPGGATTSSITVTASGTYSVTTTVSACTSLAGTGVAAPNSIPTTPVVNVVNACGSSTLSTTSAGTLSWSPGGATTSSITVTTAGTYSVTTTVSGCTSAAGTGVAAPNSTPSTPVVTVVNNCGSSTLSTTSAGTLSWSPGGATTSSITVTTAGTYSVTTTVSGCTSIAGTGVAAPKNIPTTPVVNVVNACGSSTLSTTSAGTLLWSPGGATTSSITVTTAGTYSVATTVSGCTSTAGTGVAAPISVPTTPVVNVVNGCGSSTLSTTSAGTLLWSPGGATTSSITVTTAGTYSVTTTVSGCTSIAGTGVAAPKNIPTTPVVNVVNACGSSTLSTTSAGTLLWSPGGATTSSITVTTAGTYSVTTTVSGCTSAAGTGVAAPNSTPSTPVVTVVNNCGSSTLSTTSAGALLWSPGGATTSSITVTASGTYSVTTTVSGCTSTAGTGVAAPISVPTTPVVNVVNNCGSSTLSTTAAGTLSWSPGGATTSSITVTTAGTYSVTATVGGCTSIAGTGVAAPKNVPTTPVVNVVNGCGSSTLSTTSAGTLLWSPGGATTSSITVTTAGTYSVTTTVNGCTSAVGIGVAAPGTLSTPVVTVVNSCGSSTLSTTSAGTLLWSPGGATTSSITVTTAGTYSVTATVGGCTSAAGTGVAAPGATPPTPVVNVVNACGSSTLSTTSAGTLLWSPGGATTSSITVTTAGTYSVMTTVSGCTSTAGTGVAAPISVPTTPVVNVVNACGSATLSTTAAGTLLWSPGGATTSSITVTTAGTYSVTTTVNGCTSPSGTGVAAPINIPTTPVVNVVNACGSSTLSTTSAGTLLWSPGGATTSSITVTTAGTHSVTTTVSGCTSIAGTGVAAPISVPTTPVVNVANNCGNSTLSTTSAGTLLWSPGGATTSSITVTTAGTYSVTTTVSGCTSTAGTGVAAPISVPTTPVVNVVNACGNSTLSTSSAGTLLWSPGGATTSSITVTTAGTYSVTTTINGCTSIAGTGVAAPISVPTTPVVNVVNACGSSTLSTTSAGTLLWSPGGATTSSITVTTAGTYSVTTTVSGCTSIAGTGVAAPKNIPTTPVVNVVNGCGNSTLSTTSAGTLLWSPGGTTTSSITVTTAGTYSVTATVGGCTSAAGTGVAAPINVPTTPVVNVVNGCGSSTLSTTSAGTLLWSPGGATTSSITVTTAGTYSVTTTVNGCTSAVGTGVAAPGTLSTPVVTVVNNCGSSTLSTTSAGTLLWSPGGATTSSITVTTAGTYSVTATVGGCTSAAGTGVAAPGATPPTPVVNIVNACGSSTLSTTSAGTLLWSPGGATTSSITVTTAGTYSVTTTVSGCTSIAGTGVAAPKNIPTTPVVNVVNACGSSTLSSTSAGTLLWSPGGATTSSITVTTAGTYSVTATVGGCTSIAGTGVAAPISVPTTPVVSVVNNCGSSTLSTTSAGTLLWSPGGATTSSITVTTAGTYSVTTTVSGCTSAAGTGVAAPNSTPSTPVVTVVNNCGSSTLSTTSAGTLLWSPGGATTSSITVTTAGTYSVTTTVSGCTSIAGTGVAAPKNIPTTPVVNVVNGCGNSTLSTTSAGTLLWSPGGTTTSSITVTTAGTYSVTTTVIGCSSIAGTGVAAPINVPTTPVVNVVNGCGSSTLSTTSAGTLLWSPGGATTSSITVTTAGTYSVTTTVNGCTSAVGTGMAAPGTLSTPVVTVVDNCGSSTLSTTSAGTLLWSPGGATTSSITVTTAGTYSVTATVGGCTSAAGTGVAAPGTTPPTPVVNVVNACGSSTLSTTSAGTLLWSPGGATTSSITVTTAGTYSVTTTVSGCTSIAGTGVAAPISVPTTPVVNVVNGCGSSTLSTTSAGTLLWSPGGATTSSITVTTAGTYSVTATVGGCTSTAGTGVAAPISVPTTPVVNVVNGCGSSTLSTTSAGTLLWSPGGATTSSITVTTAGTYSVTTTVNGCTSAVGTGVAAPGTLSTPVVTVVNNCGSSTLSTTSAGTLLWSPGGATTSSITVTTAGTYSVTATVGGCTSAAGTGVAAPGATPPTPVVNVVNACGSSTLSTTSAGTLLWSPGGATTSSITVTTAGTYSVTTTVSGCTSIAGTGVAAPISVPTTPVVNVVNGCGSSTLSTTSAGTLLWSPGGATTSSITVTTAGTYSVTTTVNGCTSAVGTGVAAPGTLSTPVVTVVNSCGSSTLSTTSAGTLLWSPGGATTSSITVTTAGTYSVTATVGGCTSNAGTGVAAPGTTPPTPVVNVVNGCGSSTLSTTSAGTLLWSPGGATTSSITVTTAGTYSVTATVGGCTSNAGTGVAAPGTTPPTPVVNVVNGCGSSTLSTTSAGTLLWSPGGATTSSITVTTAGTYSVTATVGGCTSNAGTGVAAPGTTPPTPVVNVVNGCGSSTLSTTSAGTLLWSPGGATTSSITITTAGTYSVTTTVNGCTSAVGTGVAAPGTLSTPVVTVVNSCGSSTLSTTSAGALLWSPGGATTSSITVTTAGTYSVTTTVSGCTSAAGTGVAAPNSTPSTPVVTVVNNCGSSTLSTTSAGTLSWSPGGATTSSITVTTAGTYSVTTTVSGCTSIAGTGVAAPISVPTTPVVNVVNACGSSTLSTTSAGTLLWSPGGATTSSITVTTAGTYSVTATVGGCTSAAGTGVAAPGATPPTPVVNVVNACGSSTLSTTSAGTLLWSPGGATTSSITVTTAGTYSVTTTVSGCISIAGTGVAAPISVPTTPVVNVVNGCGSSTLSTTSAGTLLWSPGGATTSSITVTTAGTYSVTTTVNGCTSAVGTGVAAPISVPTTPVVNVVNGCGSSTLSTTIAGTLLWSPGGATTSSITVTTAGTYSVTTTVNGCTSAVGTGLAAPGTLSTPVVTVVNSCGSSTLSTTSAGTLLWSPGGATTSSITVTTAGTYSVTATVSGCTSAAGTGVAAPGATPPTPVVNVVNACGSSTLSTTSAGTLLWSPGGATTSSITVTTAGTYSVTTTVNGCTSAAGKGVATPGATPPTPVVTVSNGCGSSTLSTTSAGSLSWSPGGATTSSITVTASGTYSVTTTVNGCTSAAGKGTAAPKSIPSTPVVTVSNGCGNSTLSTTSAGTLSWSPGGATTSSITVTTSGTYSVTTTVNGCTSAAGTGTAAPNGSAPPANCSSGCVLTCAKPSLLIGVNNCDNAANTTYSWTGPNGFTSAQQCFTISVAGTYTVKVTNTLSGCTNTCTVIATSNKTAPNVNAGANTTIGCGSSTVQLNGSSTTRGVTYSWTTGNGNIVSGANTHNPIVNAAGTYTLTVTDTTNGCTASGTVNVTKSSAPSTPVVTVANGCGSSTLTTTSAGTLQWSPGGATTSSITVTASGTYSVTATVNGCTSQPGTGRAAPKTIPAAPRVTVVNKCGSSVLTATGFTGTLSWSPGGATTDSIVVTTAGTYSVTQTVGGCTSPAGTGVAAPIVNCGGGRNIYGSGTSCSDFSCGHGDIISDICYQSYKGKVNNVQGGNFIYYAKVTAPSSNFCVAVMQTRSCDNSLAFFNVYDREAYILNSNCYASGCSNPTITSSATEQTVTICVNGARTGNTYIISVKYDVYSIIGTTAANGDCEYTFSAKIVGGATIPNSTSSLTATQSCQIVNGGGCGGDRTQAPAAPSEKSGISLSVYPNPFSDKTTILLNPSMDYNNVSVELYNLNGQKVREIYNGPVKTGEVTQLEINGNDLPDGVYIYRVSSDQESYQGRIILLKN